MSNRKKTIRTLLAIIILSIVAVFSILLGFGQLIHTVMNTSTGTEISELLAKTYSPKILVLSEEVKIKRPYGWAVTPKEYSSGVGFELMKMGDCMICKSDIFSIPITTLSQEFKIEGNRSALELHKYRSDIKVADLSKLAENNPWSKEMSGNEKDGYRNYFDHFEMIDFIKLKTPNRVWYSATFTLDNEVIVYNYTSYKNAIVLFVYSHKSGKKELKPSVKNLQKIMSTIEFTD